MLDSILKVNWARKPESGSESRDAPGDGLSPSAVTPQGSSASSSAASPSASTPVGASTTSPSSSSGPSVSGFNFLRQSPGETFSSSGSSSSQPSAAAGAYTGSGAGGSGGGTVPWSSQQQSPTLGVIGAQKILAAAAAAGGGGMSGIVEVGILSDELHKAAAAGDLSRLRVAVQRVRSDAIDKGNREGATALHVAAGHGHTFIVGELLDRQARTLVFDKIGRIPLHLAAAEGQTAVIAALLSSRGCQNATQGMLHGSGSSQILGSGAGLAGAVFHHQQAMIGVQAAAAMRSAAQLEAKDKFGRDALFFAILNGHAAAVDLLLRSGSDPRTRCSVPGTQMDLPALHAAAELGNVAIVATISDALAHNAKDRSAAAGSGGESSSKAPYLDERQVGSGRTALHCAVVAGQSATAGCLIRAGASQVAKDNSGRTPAEIAVATGSFEMVRVMKEAAAAAEKAAAARATSAQRTNTPPTPVTVLVSGATTLPSDVSRHQLFGADVGRDENKTTVLSLLPPTAGIIPTPGTEGPLGVVATAGGGGYGLGTALPYTSYPSPYAPGMGAGIPPGVGAAQPGAHLFQLDPMQASSQIQAMQHFQLQQQQHFQQQQQHMMMSYYGGVGGGSATSLVPQMLPPPGTHQQPFPSAAAAAAAAVSGTSMGSGWLAAQTAAMDFGSIPAAVAKKPSSTSSIYPELPPGAPHYV